MFARSSVDLIWRYFHQIFQHVSAEIRFKVSVKVPKTKCQLKVFDVIICKEQRLVKKILCRYGLFCMSVMPLCKILDNFLSWRQISIGRGQTCQSGTVSRFHSALLCTCRKKNREMKTYFHLTIFFLHFFAVVVNLI